MKMASFIVGWRAGVPHIKMASFIVGWRAGVPHVKMASFRSPVVTQPTGEPFQTKRNLDTQTGPLSSFCRRQNESWTPRQDCCPVVVTIRWSRTASGPQWPMTEPSRGTGKLLISPNPDHSLNVGDVNRAVNQTEPRAADKLHLVAAARTVASGRSLPSAAQCSSRDCFAICSVQFRL